MKQRYRRKPRKWSVIASKRIHILFREAERVKDVHSELSDRYVKLARKISLRYKVKLPLELKRRLCKHCGTYIVHGKNCRVRLTSGKLVYTCLNCKTYWRKQLH